MARAAYNSVIADLAQLVEHPPCKREVIRSIRIVGTTLLGPPLRTVIASRPIGAAIHPAVTKLDIPLLARPSPRGRSGLQLRRLRFNA